MNLTRLRNLLWGLVIVMGIGVTFYALMPREGGFGQVDFNLIDHKKIEQWRREQAENLTRLRRPDLLDK